MQMMMLVFRSSLKEQVHALLHRCDVKAFTEVNESVGYGIRKMYRESFLPGDSFSPPS